MRWNLAVCGAASAIVLAGCSDLPRRDSPKEQGAAEVVPPSPSATTIADLPGLHNVVAYAPGLYAGSAPYGPEGFRSLKAMGVKTVISVDGSTPDVADAHAAGLRYIHLPIEYNGMSNERRLQIARAVEDVQKEGPVYVHCHHGKHRAAAATGAAAVTLGMLTPEEAVAKMRISGTAPAYPGLFKCVETSTKASNGELDAVPDSFPEVAPTSGLIKTMVEIDGANDNLAAIQKAGWLTPADHPDLVPAAEAGRIADYFRGLGQADTAAGQAGVQDPAEFRAWMLKASERATALEETIVSGRGRPDAAAGKRLDEQFKLLAASCNECHVKYRN